MKRRSQSVFFGVDAFPIARRSITGRLLTPPSESKSKAATSATDSAPARKRGRPRKNLPDPVDPSDQLVVPQQQIVLPVSSGSEPDTTAAAPTADTAVDASEAEAGDAASATDALTTPARRSRSLVRASKSAASVVGNPHRTRSRSSLPKMPEAQVDSAPKKRGRPPKNPVQQVQQSDAQEDSAVLDQSAIDAPMLPGDTPVRGRSIVRASKSAAAVVDPPRTRSRSCLPKVSEAQADSAAKSMAAGVADAAVNLVVPVDPSQKAVTAAASSTDAPPSRKRGRPPKNPVQQGEAQVDSAVLDQQAMPPIDPSKLVATAAAASPDEPTPRKRGRPAKNPVQQLAATTTTSTADATANTVTPVVTTKKRALSLVRSSKSEASVVDPPHKTRSKSCAPPMTVATVATLPSTRTLGRPRGVVMNPSGFARFPGVGKITIDLLLDKEDLTMDKVTMVPGKYWIGRIPFKIGTMGKQRRSNGDKHVVVLVKCNDETHERFWSIDTSLTVRIGGSAFSKKTTFDHDHDESSLAMQKDIEEVTAPDWEYAVDGKIPIQVVIAVKRCLGMIQPITYTVRKDDVADATIFVGNTLVYVNSDKLALGSTFFHDKYDGLCGENKKRMMNINNCSAKEFIALINQLYVDECLFTPDNVLRMIYLSDRFKMNDIFTMAIEYFKNLDTSSPIVLANALVLSDKQKGECEDGRFRLPKNAAELQSYLIQAVFKKKVFDEIKKTPVYKNKLSSEIKVRLLEIYYSITSGEARD